MVDCGHEKTFYTCTKGDPTVLFLSLLGNALTVKWQQFSVPGFPVDPSPITVVDCLNFETVGTIANGSEQFKSSSLKHLCFIPIIVLLEIK